MLLCKVSVLNVFFWIGSLANKETVVGVVLRLIIAAQAAKQLTETVQLRLAAEVVVQALTGSVGLLLALVLLTSAAHWLASVELAQVCQILHLL
jgi:hypothetical protein